MDVVELGLGGHTGGGIYAVLGGGEVAGFSAGYTVFSAEGSLICLLILRG